MTQTAQEVDREAADWAARVDRGLTAAEHSELNDWLGGDVRRVGAYGRMRALALHTERVSGLGPVHSPRDFGSEGTGKLSRRRFLAGSAIAASLAGIGVAGWLAMDQGHVRTRKGEMRQIALQDGSVVTLNTLSEIAVNLTSRRREIHVLAGEVLFEVARDIARPFVVTAGPLIAKAVSTRFAVRALPGKAIQLFVQRGAVEVTRTGQIDDRQIKLTANMRAVSRSEHPDGPGTIDVAPIPAAAMLRAIAWRDGHIRFQGETLSQAAAEFARYGETRIVIVDPDLAQERIAGLYRTNDPVGFAKAAAASLRVRTNITSGEIQILK
jgi:transmembrane sensor